MFVYSRTKSRLRVFADNFSSAAFIGEGLGGVLPRYDMDVQALELLLSRDEDESASEALRDYKQRRASDAFQSQPPQWNSTFDGRLNSADDLRRPLTGCSDYSTPPFPNISLPNSSLAYPSPQNNSGPFIHTIAAPEYTTNHIDAFHPHHYEPKRLNPVYQLSSNQVPHRSSSTIEGFRSEM